MQVFLKKNKIIVIFSLKNLVVRKKNTIFADSFVVQIGRFVVRYLEQIIYHKKNTQ